jgi:4-amino-4-deoxy-L-arabinose transferase-like glycosyltransferase
VGRIIASKNPSRLTVLVAGSFPLAYLVGLIAFSGYSDQSGLTLESLLAAASACVAWLMIAMMVMDSPKPGMRLLTRLLEKGLIIEIAGVAILFGLWLVVALTMMPWNDELSNIEAARFLFQHGFGAYFNNYTEVNDWLGPHHPPLLPLVYAGIYSVFGAEIIVGRLFGCLCALCACCLAYLWIKRQAGRRMALVACALCLSYPLVWFNGASSILDPPFWLIFTACLLLFDRYMESRKALDGLWCGLCIGVAVLSRYNGFLLPPIFLIMLLCASRGRRALKQIGTWLVIIGPALILLPWFAYAAWTGSLWIQAQKLGSFVLVMVIPDGGFFYVRNFLVPLIPFMVGLWNVPLWVSGFFSVARHERDMANFRLAMVGIIYVAFVLVTLPNPRYLLAVAPSLAVLPAFKVLEAEDSEGRGLELLVFLLGLSLIHVALVVHQTSIGEVYFFY